MLANLRIPALAGFFILAGAVPAAAADIQCSVPQAPSISITPVSEQIQYDFSLASRDLTRMKSGTAAATAGSDTATGGLRVDQPAVTVKVVMGNARYESLKQDCLWYHDVNVTILLRPQIYVAKEYNVPGPCRDAIMAHELRHVDVDREMMNKYAFVIGETVRDSINKVGAIGPFANEHLAALKQKMVDRAQAAVAEVEIPLRTEMRQRQAQVDSIDEYKRISAICYGAR